MREEVSEQNPIENSAINYWNNIASAEELEELSASQAEVVKSRKTPHRLNQHLKIFAARER